MNTKKKKQRRAVKKTTTKKKAAKKVAKKKKKKKKAKGKAPAKKTPPKKKAKDDDEPKKEGKTLAEVRDAQRAATDSIVIYETDQDTTPIYPTRFMRLNRIIGGGLRAGAIIEVYGPEDSGKSSESIAFAADVQRQAPPGKRTVLLVNFEGPQPYAWWRQLGLDTREGGDHPAFIQLRPRSLEHGMAKSIEYVETGEVCCVIYDSIYAASSRASKELLSRWGEASKSAQDPAGIAVEARQWGKAWNATKITFMEHEVVVIAVNQSREDMQMGGAPKKGWTTRKRQISTRGKALKFFAWVRIEMSGHVLVTEKGEIRKDVDGRQLRMRVIKNKTSGDERGTARYDLIRGFGFDLVGDLITLGLEAGIIKGGKGGHYQMGPKKIRGRERLREVIEGSPRLQVLMRQRIEAYLADLPIDELDDEF